MKMRGFIENTLSSPSNSKNESDLSPLSKQWKHKIYVDFLFYYIYI